MGTSTPLAVLVGLPRVGMSEQLEAMKLSAPLSSAGVRVHADVGPSLIQTLLFLPAGKPRVTTQVDNVEIESWHTPELAETRVPWPRLATWVLEVVRL